jgi:hypothetical protein
VPHEISSHHHPSFDPILQPDQFARHRIDSLVRERFTLAAAAITAYDAEYDEDEKAVRAAAGVIRELSQ